MTKQHIFEYYYYNNYNKKIFYEVDQETITNFGMQCHKLQYLELDLNRWANGYWE